MNLKKFLGKPVARIKAKGRLYNLYLWKRDIPGIQVWTRNDSTISVAFVMTPRAWRSFQSKYPERIFPI